MTENLTELLAKVELFSELNADELVNSRERRHHPIGREGHGHLSWR